MTDVVSFRPTPEELEAIERARRSMALESRTEAVRYLLRRGAKGLGKLSEEPVFRFRVPKQFRGGATFSSRDIDELLYGRGDE